MGHSAIKTAMLDKKSRKTPGVATEIVQQAITAFGAEVCDGQVCLDWSIELCKTSSDAAVKKAAQGVLVECYKAYGDDVEGAVEDGGVKKAIVKSLKKQFAKAGAASAPTRYRRGEKPAPGGGSAAAAPKAAAAKPKPKPKPKIKLKGKDIFADLDKDFDEAWSG